MIKQKTKDFHRVKVTMALAALTQEVSLVQFIYRELTICTVAIFRLKNGCLDRCSIAPLDGSALIIFKVSAVVHVGSPG